MLAVSCSGNLFTDNELPADEYGELQHEMIVLGDQLEDPYSVDNMAKALTSLYSTKADRGSVSTTDYYVRFLPKNEDQFRLLENMGVNMLDHPMDYEILREGDYYHDPSVGDDEITWQYAVVSKDFVFPSEVEYEILEDCFLPENSSTKADWVDWAEVEKEAFRLTGNDEMLQPSTKAGSNCPEGRITIVDDAFPDKEIGVKGVTVSCNVFVKFAHAFTDEDGNYKMSKSFSANPRYRLLFKNRKGFAMGLNLILIPASFSTLGKGSPSGVSIKIDSNSERKLFTRSVVNNAGYEYYESCEGEDSGMKTPPANLRIWLFQNLERSLPLMLQQGAIVDASALGKYLGTYSFILKLFLPDVSLGLQGCDTYADVYSAAVHQFAHAGHYMQVGNDFWNPYIKYLILSFVTSGFVAYGIGTENNHGYCEVAEMWAFYIQERMMNERYGTEEEYGTSYWFYPQIFSRLDERGINRYRIFAALTSDICDKDSLQKKLVSLYPESKSIINQAFGKYN